MHELNATASFRESRFFCAERKTRPSPFEREPSVPAVSGDDSVMKAERQPHVGPPSAECGGSDGAESRV